MKMKRFALIALAALAIAAEADAETFAITDLGWSSGNAYGINNSGQVAGYAVSSGYRAQLYSGGSSTSLGTLTGSGSSYAYGINNAGVVVGGSSASGGGTHAFVYNSAAATPQMVDLNTQVTNNPSNLTLQYAQAINSSGQIVGSSTNSHGYLFSNGTVTDLGNLGSSSSTYAYGINSSGTIVGGSSSGDGASDVHAFKATVTNGVATMTDLQTLAGMNAYHAVSYAYGINDSGVIVGQSNIASNGAVHAFYYDTSMHDLGTLGGSNSYAYGINASGEIVGSSSYTMANNVQHAFLATLVNGQYQMVDLNSLLPAHSGWTLTAAWSIDANGDIVGYGTNPQGYTDAFLLTAPAAVPEPSSLVLMGLGAIAGLGYRVRARRRAKAVA